MATKHARQYVSIPNVLTLAMGTYQRVGNMLVLLVEPSYRPRPFGMTTEVVLRPEARRRHKAETRADARAEGRKHHATRSIVNGRTSDFDLSPLADLFNKKERSGGAGDDSRWKRWRLDARRADRQFHADQRFAGLAAN